MGLFNKDDNKEEKKVVRKPSKEKASHDHDHDYAATEERKISKRSVRAGSEAYRVLIQPLVSEKAAINESKGVYTFVVAMNATKVMIKQAIRDVYGVKATDVRIINVQGRDARFGRTMGRRSDWKKAIVTIEKGKTISIHEGV